MRVQQLENIKLVFDFMEDEGIKLVSVRKSTTMTLHLSYHKLTKESRDMNFSFQCTVSGCESNTVVVMFNTGVDAKSHSQSPNHGLKHTSRPLWRLGTVLHLLALACNTVNSWLLCLVCGIQTGISGMWHMGSYWL